MAITASGIYGPAVIAAFSDTLGFSLGIETMKVALVNDTHAPDFDLDDFFDDIDNEVTGTGWAAGGVALTGTTLTGSSGVVTFDATDVSETGTTLTNAMASVLYQGTGTAATDDLVMLHDFVTAVSTSSGTFGIAWNASGLATIDHTP